MNIERAIEIKEEYLHDNQPYDLQELEEADRISIEALKRHKQNSECFESGVVKPLLGETED